MPLPERMTFAVEKLADLLNRAHPNFSRHYYPASRALDILLRGEKFFMDRDATFDAMARYYGVQTHEDAFQALWEDCLDRIDDMLMALPFARFTLIQTSALRRMNFVVIIDGLPETSFGSIDTLSSVWEDSRSQMSDPVYYRFGEETPRIPVWSPRDGRPWPYRSALNDPHVFSVTTTMRLLLLQWMLERREDVDVERQPRAAYTRRGGGRAIHEDRFQIIKIKPTARFVRPADAEGPVHRGWTVSPHNRRGHWRWLSKSQRWTWVRDSKIHGGGEQPQVYEVG